MQITGETILLAHQGLTGNAVDPFSLKSISSKAFLCPPKHF